MPGQNSTHNMIYFPTMQCHLLTISHNHKAPLQTETTTPPYTHIHNYRVTLITHSLLLISHPQPHSQLLTFFTYKFICLFLKKLIPRRRVRCADTSNLCVKEAHGTKTTQRCEVTNDCNMYLWRMNCSLPQKTVLIQVLNSFPFDQWFSNIFSYGTQYIKQT